MLNKGNKELAKIVLAVALVIILGFCIKSLVDNAYISASGEARAVSANCVTIELANKNNLPKYYSAKIVTQNDTEQSQVFKNKQSVANAMRAKTPFVFEDEDVLSYSIKEGMCSLY